MVSTGNRFVSTSTYIFVFVVTAVLVVGPLVTGAIIRDYYEKYLDKISAHLNLQIRVAEYNQNWFSSDVTLKITGIYFDGEFLLYDRLLHGPVYLGLLNQGRFPVAMAVIEGELRSGQSSVLDDLFARKTPVVYQTVLEYSGNYDALAHVPAIVSSSSIGGNSFEVVSSPVTFSLKHVKNTGQYTAEGTWPELSFNNNEQSIRIDGLKLSYDSGKNAVAENRNSTFETDVVLVFDEYDQVTKNQQTVVRDFGFRHIGATEDGRVDTESAVTIREVLVNNEQLGPVDIKLIAENLHAVALSNVFRIARASLQRVTRSVPMYQIRLIANKKLQKNIGPLFVDSTIIADPVYIKSESGDISITVAFAHDKSAGNHNNRNVRGDTDFLMGHMLDVDISVDHHAYELAAGLVRNNTDIEKPGEDRDASAKILAQLLSKGIFVDDGEAYRFRYHEDSGGVIINKGAAKREQLSELFH